MDLLPIKELVKRRRKLVKSLEPLTGIPSWTAEDERDHQRIIHAEIAAIDAEIAERTGRGPAEEKPQNLNESNES